MSVAFKNTYPTQLKLSNLHYYILPLKLTDNLLHVQRSSSNSDNSSLKFCLVYKHCDLFFPQNYVLVYMDPSVIQTSWFESDV